MKDTKIKMRYELHGTAEGYAIRGIIEGEFGHKRFIDKPTRGKSIKNFYRHSNGWDTQRRETKVTYPQYRKLFNV